MGHLPEQGRTREGASLPSPGNHDRLDLVSGTQNGGGPSLRNPGGLGLGLASGPWEVLLPPSGTQEASSGPPFPPPSPVLGIECLSVAFCLGSVKKREGLGRFLSPWALKPSDNCPPYRGPTPWRSLLFLPRGETSPQPLENLSCFADRCSQWQGDWPVECREGDPSIRIQIRCRKSVP